MDRVERSFESLETKASFWPPTKVSLNAPDVVGKSEPVQPVTKTLSDESRNMEVAAEELPRKVELDRVERSFESLETKALVSPKFKIPKVSSNAPDVVGKSEESV